MVAKKKQREKQFTPDAMGRYIEMDRLQNLVTEKIACNPTQELPGSPLKIVIMSKRWEYINLIHMEGDFRDDD